MRILLTGASSFTGFWFAKALADAGHEVLAPVTRAVSEYDGVRLRRVEALADVATIVEGVSFGADRFLELSDEVDLVAHHAAYVTGYRDDDFDTLAAVEANTLGARSLVSRLARRGARGLLVTGSVFEAGEGAGSLPMRAFSPYGLSKTLSHQVFDYWCSAENLPLAKFVIPNPFGPFEEPRFTAYLIKTWAAGQVAGVKTPAYVRDNIHVDLLALAYARLAQSVGTSEHLSRLNPSGYVESQGAFAERFASAMRERLGYDCGLDLQVQTEFPEPVVRINTQPAAADFPAWNETSSWDRLADYYRPA